ncbi:MAG: hypothetical protein BroJett029_26960 [Alphaproteobacteria bacterium]|nr:MAG: hypothetical protein BroJett029_26960 [Alphaproteobacteria bacterium]
MILEANCSVEFLSRPQFTQTEVLKVTRLTAATLQTWVNRGLLDLSEQNPGTGKRRQYSALDVVRLAIIKRLTRFGFSVSVARTIARHGVAWCFGASDLSVVNLGTYLVITPWDGPEPSSEAGRQWCAEGFRWSLETGLPEDIRLSDLGRFATPSDPHRSPSEPFPTFLLLPIGEIVAAVLRDLRKLLKDEAQ